MHVQLDQRYAAPIDAAAAAGVRRIVKLSARGPRSSRWSRTGTGTGRSSSTPFAAEQVVTVFGELRRGVQATTTGTVNALTGRSARPFKAFARQYADAFRSEEPTGLTA